MAGDADSVSFLLVVCISFGVNCLFTCLVSDINGVIYVITVRMLSMLILPYEYLSVIRFKNIPQHWGVF